MSIPALFAISVPVLVQGLIGGVVFAAMYAIVAIGLALVFKCGRFINTAHGAVMMVAVYIVAGALPGSTPGWLALLLAALIGAGVSLTLAGGFVLPLTRLISNKETIFLSLIGFLFMAAGVTQVIWGASPLFINPVSTATIRIGIYSISGEDITVVAVVLVVVLVLWYMLERTMLGRAFRALGEDAEGASVVGISAKWLLLLAMGLAGLLAGGAGALLAAEQGGVNPNSALSWTVLGLAAAAVGGVDSVLGCAVGGVALGLISGAMISINPIIYDAVPYLGLLIVLAARPEGLLGGRAH